MRFFNRSQLRNRITPYFLNINPTFVNFVTFC